MERLERCLQQHNIMRHCYLFIADEPLKDISPIENIAFQFGLQDQSRNLMKPSDHHFGCFL